MCIETREVMASKDGNEVERGGFKAMWSGQVLKLCRTGQIDVIIFKINGGKVASLMYQLRTQRKLNFYN